MTTIQSESSESYPHRLDPADVFFRGEPDEEEDEEEDRRKKDKHKDDAEEDEDNDDEDESGGYSMSPYSGFTR